MTEAGANGGILLSVPCLRIGLNQNRNLKLNLTLRGVVPRHPAQEVHPQTNAIPYACALTMSSTSRILFQRKMTTATTA
eukprot:COSAG01_NODE_6831_length_3480_cov_314.546584_6_plen_79_part_00